MTRYAIIILFLAISVALFLTQTQPYFDKINVLKKDREAYAEVLNRSRELQALRDELFNQYNSISRESFDNLDKLLPKQIDPGTLIAMFENIMKTRGFLLKRINVQESEISTGKNAGTKIIGVLPPPYKIVNLSFLISGPYGNFPGLFSDLEKSVRIIDIKSVAFGVGASDFFELNIDAKTYAFSSPPVPIIAGDGREKGEKGQEILTMLERLRDARINADFFENEAFKSLVDFAPVLEMPQSYGRLNPFSKIESSVTKK